MDIIECNDLEIGDFKFDVFITDNGSFGITVYTPRDDKYSKSYRHSRDIIVSRDLKEVLS